MKKLIILAALLAIFAASSRAADWVDQGDGTWTLSVSITASTTDEKDKWEQIRASHNYEYRYVEDSLDASAFIEGILEGFTATQVDGDPVTMQFAGYLWETFKTTWLTPLEITNSEDGGDTEGLAFSVPAPPNTP